MLCSGVDAISEMPADRFALDRLFDRDPSQPGRIYTRWGGFIEGIDLFDAAFFGMSPREARHIDPQQRLLLELTWEAMEDAGIRAEDLAGSRTGVFIGISTHDYGDIQTYPENRHLVGSHTNTGTATSLAANRISHAYDFRGPSMIVDTACSSSLTALHLACQSLRSDECDVAIVGGVQMLVTPEPTIGFCKASMLSPDGRCRAFDARANGYVRSEGGGVVVLRPLAAAVANADPIYAVVLATAINQDGHTTGMTVPSGRAQEAMLRTALAHAGLTPADVHYIEAHGTGTAVGDPIEAAAMGAVLSEGLPPGRSCAIGSVKTNIGHLEAASGMAGLIKTALAIRHRAVPPSLHFESPNPAIDFEGLRLRVVTSLEPWPGPPGVATAGVNGFGFGGANAHVVLQEHDLRAAAQPESRPANDVAELLVLSAKSAPALAGLAREYMTVLAGDAPLRAVCASAALRRATLTHRLSIVGNRAEVVDGLDAFIASERRAAVTSARVPATGPVPLAFVFNGMGPQWWAMGRQLLRDEPVFRATVERCDAAMPREASWSLLAELQADEAASRVSDADLAQVTGFAVQAGLAELLRSRGIVPAAVFGHSAGEMAAAFVSGALTLEACVPLAYHRSRLQASAPPGRMLATAMSEADALRLVNASEGHLSLAAVNSPSSVTLSGDARQLEALHERLQREQVFARLLPFPVAYHSATMDSIERELLDSLAFLAPRNGAIPMVSAVTGRWVDGSTLDAQYWWKNVRQPVRFADGVARLLADGYRTVLEIGPHPVLASSMAECLAAAAVSGTVLPTLRRNEDERAAILRAIGALHAHGSAVDWRAVFGNDWVPVSLPLYAWDRERHWFERTPDTQAPRALMVDGGGSHPLLGRRLETANATWESSLAQERVRYLDDHVVQGAVVFPGVAYLEMAAAAVREMRPGAAVVLRDVSFVSPLFGDPGRSPRVQLTMDRDGRFDVQSHAGSDASWTLHANGRAVPRPHAATTSLDLDAVRGRCGVDVSHEACYAHLEARGLAYGSAFRGIQSLSTGSGEALGRVALAAPLSADDDYVVHPALFDAALQVLIGAAASAQPDERVHLFLPVGIHEVSYRQPVAKEAWSYARVTARNERHVTGDVEIVGDDGAVLLSVRGLRCQIVEAAKTHAADSMDDWLYEDLWEPAPLTHAGASAISTAAVDLTHLQLEADRLSEASGWSRYYGEIEPALDALACAHIMRALGELGWTLTPGERMTSAAMYAGIPESRRPFAERLLGFLETTGVLRREQDGYIVARPAPSPSAAAELSSDCRTAWPDYKVHLDLLDRCGSSLAANLRGERSAQEVLFGNEGSALLETFYREAPASAFYNALAARVVSSLVRDVPDGQPFRILEVGAGTGGTTAAVLPSLERTPDAYVFSDVSRHFLDGAQARFGTFPFLSTAIYDLEADQPALGFPAGRFDIILAANVVHATSDVSRALERLRDLLEPGGVLVLLEITRQPMWLDVVFGLTEGWWQFQDRAARPDHPLVSGPRWESLLTWSGFDDVVSVTDSQHPGEAAQTVIMARAPLVEAPVAADGSHWMILSDGLGVGRQVAARLPGCAVLTSGERFERTGAEVFTCRPSSADDLTAVFDALEAGGRAVRNVMHLQSLDVVEAETADALLASQRVSCGPALALVRALAGRAQPPQLWLVTAGAQESASGAAPVRLGQSSLWGLGRVIMREHPELRCRLIDLSASPVETEIDALAREMSIADHEEEVAFRDGARFARRLHRVAAGGQGPIAESRQPLAGERWSAHIGTPGALQTLEFRHRLESSPGPDQVEVRISAASINFRDVMVAMGTIPGLEQETSFGSRQLGLDASGTISACGSEAGRFRPGDAVMGIVPGAFGSSGITSEALLTLKPATLDFEQASAVPCAFVTAHYALNVLAQLRSGERVLIHSATGGVGLAAIQFAKDAGAEIFATAGSPDKCAYLRSLGIRHVMDSRSTAFADEILRATGGEGVDVVLNSLAGEALSAGLRILRPFGRFLEIGKRDIYEDGQIGLLPFRKNLSLHAIDLDRLCVERPDFVGTLLREVGDRFESGSLQPLPQRVWPISEVEKALRFMAQARHMGKIVLSIDDPAVALAGARVRVPLFKADGTYLISGGLGGFGLAVAERLLGGGAGAVALVGRRPPSTEVEQRLEELRRKTGARVDALQGDVASASDVARILHTVRTGMPPLRGVVHAAMVLDDGRLDQMEWPQFERVLAPKIGGAWNLHTQTRTDALDLFVMFSSIAALLGNPLQGNYAAANAYLDALAHHRRALGVPGLSVAWGVLSGVGYVAGRPELSDYLARQGYLAFSPAQAFGVLEDALRDERATIMAARMDWTRWAVASPTAATSPRFRRFAARVSAEGTGAGQGTRSAMAVDLSDPATRRQRLDEYLRGKIARVLGASPASIEPDRALTEMGLDSLIAVELMTALRIDIGLELPVVKLLQGISMNGLASLALDQMPDATAAVAQPVAMPHADPLPVPVPARPAPAPVQGIVEAVREVEPARDTARPPDSGTLAEEPATRDDPQPTQVSGTAQTNWSTGQRFVRGGLTAAFRATTDLSVEGLGWLPAHGPAVLAVNHLSSMDVPLALAVLPRPVIMLAKDDLRRSRLLDWLLSDIGRAIYVRRGEGDHEALDQALAVLRSGGIVALGPEGRRSPGGLTQGHTGVGYLAARAGVPVVPMAAWGQERLGHSWRRLHRAPIRVRFGPPITFAGSTPSGRELREYSDAVMRAIAAQLPIEYRGIYGE
jgi:1-acyl-sn-glycerol-3-phosphate acyltransferase